MCLERVRRVPGMAISFSLLLFFHQLVLREEAERRKVKPVAKKEWRGGDLFSLPCPSLGTSLPPSGGEIRKDEERKTTLEMEEGKRRDLALAGRKEFAR